MSDTNEQILLFQIRTFRSESAFERLVVMHREALYRFLRGKLPTEEDAKDVSTIVLFRVWNYLTTTHETKASHFRGLVFHVARNAVADYYRTRKQTTSIESMEEEGMQFADARDTVKRTEAGVDLKLIRALLSKLKPEYQDVIALRMFEGLDIGEIADKLEKTDNNVRVTLHRALAELRKHL